ncbi:hypothetical protein GobsT_23180 [Gemmata obscuriglobus]|uniref:Uncharacterized protein n=1 Tax=Gemmata obscuriglobus TaxID=114 RepID=A0A2Z3H6X1_9BACT|nr:hypothetical protein [Gemmata obscuriglobus]AWM39367.1 hypothetical protein C1280_21850 [Gemmata obscuriglobus]QEG27562.1 hypothetical protein GobsT_23180 [Gemmata obscuriglobus]VTS04645.1 unnamed protein product [Gemmata obscuriglobus UQM 2246]
MTGSPEDKVPLIEFVVRVGDKQFTAWGQKLPEVGAPFAFEGTKEFGTKLQVESVGYELCPRGGSEHGCWLAIVITVGPGPT